MKVQALNSNRYVLSFDNEEIIFLIREAKDNEITVIEIFEMLLGQLFIGGYSNVIGKD